MQRLFKYRQTTCYRLLSDHVMAMHTGKKRNKNKAEELAAAYQCETHAEKASDRIKAKNEEIMLSLVSIV